MGFSRKDSDEYNATKKCTSPNGTNGITENVGTLKMHRSSFHKLYLVGTDS